MLALTVNTGLTLNALGGGKKTGADSSWPTWVTMAPMTTSANTFGT